MNNKLLEEIYNKDASKCSMSEMELSMMIPFYSILSQDKEIDILKINNHPITREDFMKKFNSTLKKVKRERTTQFHGSGKQ
jgi:hypothetical protein